MDIEMEKSVAPFIKNGHYILQTNWQTERVTSVPHVIHTQNRDSMQVGSMNPYRWWNGDQVVTEVNKYVYPRPVVETVGILIAATIHKPDRKISCDTLDFYNLNCY